MTTDSQTVSATRDRFVSSAVVRAIGPEAIAVISMIVEGQMDESGLPAVRQASWDEAHGYVVPLYYGLCRVREDGCLYRDVICRPATEEEVRPLRQAAKDRYHEGQDAIRRVRAAIKHMRVNGGERPMKRSIPEGETIWWDIQCHGETESRDKIVRVGKSLWYLHHDGSKRRQEGVWSVGKATKGFRVSADKKLVEAIRTAVRTAYGTNVRAI